MSTLPFSMLPAEDPQATPDEELQAAVAGALALPLSQTPVPDPPPVPMGKTWQFDFEAGRFVRAGGSPAETRDVGALEQWCLMALHSARYGSLVFSAEFGMDEPDSPIGEFAHGEVLADWEAAIVDALMVHDRISAVENFDMTWDPVTGTLFVNNFDVVTDEEQTVAITDVTLRIGASS